MPVTVSQDACISCGACVGICPASALFINLEGKAECDESMCINCLTCIGICPVEAISEK